MRAYGIRAARMSTRSPRNGTPSSSSSARCRAPLASDPSARTIRHQGTSGSSLRDEDGAGEARRARRDVAVGADEALGDRADALAARRSVLSSARCAMGRIQSWPSIRRRASSASRCSRTGSRVGPLCAWARAGVGAVATQSVVEPAYGPNALDRLADGIPAPAGARRAAGRRPAGRRPAGRGDRRARHGSASTRARTASSTPATSTGEHSQLPGQHDGPRHRPGRRCRRRSRRPTARCSDRLLDRARRGRGARAATSAAASRRRWSSCRADGEPWRRTVDLRVEDHAAPLDRAATAAHAPARLRPRGRGRRAARRGPHRRGGRALPRRPRSSPRTRTSCCSGPASPAPRPETSTPAWPRSGERSRRTRTGWSSSTGSHRSSLRRAVRSACVSRCT